MVLNLPSKPKTDVDFDEGELSPLSERGALGAIKPKELPSAIVDKLTAILTPEHLPASAKLIYRPILFVAAGVHALFLFMPQGQEAKKAPEQKEKPITISQVATGKAAVKVPTTKLPAAKIEAPKISLPKVNLPSPTAPSLPSSKPKEEEKKQQEAPKTATPDKPLPDVKQNQDTTPPPPGGGAKDGDPFQDFVQHPSAQSGCYDSASCMKVSGASMDSVIGVFKTKLGEKKFELTEQSKDGEKAVYQVSKGGVSKFLTIMADGSDVVYVLNDQPFPGIQAFKEGKVVELPATVASAISGIATENATHDDFDQANLYYDISIDSEGFDVTTPKSGVYKTYTIPNQQPEQAFGTLDSILRDAFKGGVKEVGSYGGGKVYQLSNGKTNFYLNLINRKNTPTDSIGIIFVQSPI